MPYPILLLALLILLGLAACGPLPPVSQPATYTSTPDATIAATPDGTPELPAPTASATAEPEPTPVSSPVITPELPTPAQTEPAGAEIDFGPAEISIIRPGQLSRVSSPVRVIIALANGNSRLVQFSLIGEDGRAITTFKDWTLPYLDPVNGNLTKDIEFSIPGVAEAGRLEISLQDSFGRILALNSVELILLSTGGTDRNYAPENRDRVMVQLPSPGATIQGGSLLIAGFVRTRNGSPLTVWLIDEAGNKVGEGEAPVVLAEGAQQGQFVGEIAYTVAARTPVRLVIALPAEGDSGYTFIKSMEIILNP